MAEVTPAVAIENLCEPIIRRRRAPAGEPGDSLTFTCELGPKPYAISGPDGNDLSDRWAEAKLLKARIEPDAIPVRTGQQGCQISA